MSVARVVEWARPWARAHARHLLLGAAVAGLLAGPRWPPVVLTGALVAATGAVLVRGTLRILALGLIAALLAGAVVADARLHALDRTELGPRLGHAATVRAMALEAPRARGHGSRAVLSRLTEGLGTGERIVIRTPPWAPRMDVDPGDELRVGGRLQRLGPRDAYDRRRHAHAVLLADRLAPTGRRRGGIVGVLDGVRARTERALTAGVPAPQGALARGMVLGQDDALDDDVRESFRATGLSHLVAASGANVMLLATLALAAGTAAGLGLTPRLVLALVLVVAYVPLAGGGPSIQRAGVMGAVGLVALLSGRPGSRVYALLVAAAVTLGVDPRAAEDPGWQLSFAAVVALLIAVRPAARALRRGGLPGVVAEAVAVTLAATAGTAPLVALHFGRLSLVSLPANVLAAPAVAPVMWLGTVAGALAQAAPPVAAPVAALASLPLAYLTWLADRASLLGWAEIAIGRPSVLTVVGVYLGLGAGLVAVARRRSRDPSDSVGPPGRRWRRAPAVALLAALAAAGAALARPPRPPSGLVVTFLDVGQGDATLVQHGGHAVLVDTGAPGAPIRRRLREAGVRDLDVLVLTHHEADHDGNAAAVLASHRVRLVLDGAEASGAGPSANAALAARVRARDVPSDRGQVVRAGPIELRVLWPPRDPPAAPGADPNLRATVLHVRDGALDVLLGADAESEVLSGLDLPRVDVLKVSHHGSADPGLPGVLARLAPRVAVISVGAENTYGHPVPATVRALGAAVPVVRRTDRDGSVRVRLRAGHLQVRSAR